MPDEPRTLSDEMVDRIARRLTVIGDPTRIRLLNELRDGEATVGHLTETAGTTQQNVSRHLGLLHAEGIVARRKDGNFVRYRIADHSVVAICDAVCGDVIEQLDRARAAVSEGLLEQQATL
jgi:DNA-binding transcriptional ArsR family regulator